MTGSRTSPVGTVRRGRNTCTVGFATLAYALAIGPLVHVFLPRLTVPTADVREPVTV